MVSRPKATIHDVAARAGVSIATVSRVLNDSRPVADELRLRVLAAVDDLGYRANLLGRALRQGRSYSIGLVVPDLENPFFAVLAQELSRSFARIEIEVLISSADNDLERERHAVASFIGRQVDGLVLIPCDESRSAASVRLASRSVVTVQLDRSVRQVRTHFVGCDNAHGMRLLAEHVREAASRSRAPVIFIAARPLSSSAHERLDCFASAFPRARQFLGDFSFEFGLSAMDRVIDVEGAMRGVVVTGADVIALGVLASLHKHGFSVPQDFQVTGFDDVGVSFLAQPALTTVRQDVSGMCEAIVDIVRFRFEQPDAERDLVIRRFKPTLVMRDSCPEPVAVPLSDGV